MNIPCFQFQPKLLLSQAHFVDQTRNILEINKYIFEQLYHNKYTQLT